MDILITGGAGFIGSNLALKLIEKGHSVTVLDNLSIQIHGTEPENTSDLFKSINGKVKFIRGSVTNREDLSNAIQSQEVIIHLAAETGTGQSMYQIQKYADVNVGGTALLLDILANDKHQVKKVVVASSRAIYGEGKYRLSNGTPVYPLSRLAADMDRGDFEVKFNKQTVYLMPTDEESKIHPSSVYGITKQSQEQMIMTVCKSIGIAAVAFRYQNVYGPGQSLKNPYTGILSIFSTQIKNGNDINIFEDGEESRDFVFIDDVVDATILGIEKEDANNEVFNVGSGIPTPVTAVANHLIKAYNGKVNLNVTGNYRLGDIRHNYADITKISTVLGYQPKVFFEEGIERFSKWVDTQATEADNYDRSIEELKLRGLYK